MINPLLSDQSLWSLWCGTISMTIFLYFSLGDEIHETVLVRVKNSLRPYFTWFHSEESTCTTTAHLNGFENTRNWFKGFRKLQDKYENNLVQVRNRSRTNNDRFLNNLSPKIWYISIGFWTNFNAPKCEKRWFHKVFCDFNPEQKLFLLIPQICCWQDNLYHVFYSHKQEL